MFINQLLPFIVVLAITGAGIVTGLLFAFSNFVMKALAELEDEHGMFAMQQINEKILNPLFLFLFLGTPFLCLLIGIYCVVHISNYQNVLLLIGALMYIIGPFGITVTRNVPLNNQLAAVKATEGSVLWNQYQKNWQRWNHIRTYIGIVSIVFLCLGLSF